MNNQAKRKSGIRKGLLISGNLLFLFCILAGLAWAFGAIWYLDYLPGWLAKTLAVVYLAVGIFVLRRSFRRNALKAGERNTDRQKTWLRVALVASVPVVYLATLFIRPTNDRIWADDQQVFPAVSINGDQVTIQNFRNFSYTSSDPPIQNYESFSFNIDQLESVWYIVQRFTRYNGMAHTFVSFGIDTPVGKKYFCISVEIRREKGELYSPIQGMYRRYELMYVVGSEQDLIGVRTNVRENDRVFLYRGTASPKQVQQLFLRFAKRIETLRNNPEFYHTLLSNCTNNIVAHTRSMTPKTISLLSPRIMLPGYSAEVAFDHGLIGRPNQTFEDLQQESRIDGIARKAGITEDFSRDIRHR